MLIMCSFPLNASFLSRCCSRYKIVLSTDNKEFAGHDRLDMSVNFFTFEEPWNGRPCSMKVRKRERRGREARGGGGGRERKKEREKERKREREKERKKDR